MKGKGISGVALEHGLLGAMATLGSQGNIIR